MAWSQTQSHSRPAMVDLKVSRMLGNEMKLGGRSPSRYIGSHSSLSTVPPGSGPYL